MTFIIVKNPNCIYAFGQHVKSLRKQQRLSQQKLADKADIDKKTLQKIEMNRYNPSLDIICSIAIGLDMELNELLTFKFEKRKE